MSVENSPYQYQGLDRLFHEKARLGVMTSLASHPNGLSFVTLKQLCALTDGNLSRHLKILQEAGIVKIEKSFEKNRPLTMCALTPKGRTEFHQYLTVLEQVVRDAAHGIAGTESQSSDLSFYPK